MLHYASDFVVKCTEVRAIQGPQIQRELVGCFTALSVQINYIMP